MPLAYKTTAWVRCWKQHTCSACGCVYRYKVERSGQATAFDEGAARRDAGLELDWDLGSHVESYPCPTCGLVQPDMVAAGKLLWHGAVTAVTLPALLVLVPLGAGHEAFKMLLEQLPRGADPTAFAATAAAVVLGLAALAHLVVALHNPNDDRQANRERAEAERVRGLLATVEAGSATPRTVPRNLRPPHLVALLAVVGAVPFFLGPVLSESVGGTAYRQLWWEGATVSGLAGVLGGALLTGLAFSLRSLAEPTAVVPLQTLQERA